MRFKLRREVMRLLDSKIAAERLAGAVIPTIAHVVDIDCPTLEVSNLIREVAKELNILAGKIEAAEQGSGQ